ncbi:fungal specific transcription factor domain-containing protein [Stagonosporopsis vannaccii]|nr:fungal specific transcription factor domain-containing protein [Stagonosporopsis vannaccii]
MTAASTTTFSVPSPAPSPAPGRAASTAQPLHKAFSCILCAQRKVKCDKKPGGCSNCTKARVPCIYKAPPPPRRRRKGVRDVDTKTRLRIYENALRNVGIDPESLLKQASLSGDDQSIHARVDATSANQPAMDLCEESTPIEVGVLVTEDGKSRYLENGIWTSLRSEFRDLKEILDETSEEETDNTNLVNAPEPFSPDGSRLMFGSPTSSTGLRPLHPQPVESFRLWQAYLENINPLIKLFHAPTVQQMLSEANSNLDDMPRNVEALLFSIYSIAVESLSDGDCIAILGDHKNTARQRFRSGAQHALINASFLKTSDVMVLQALTLFILSLQDIDARIIWMLSGLCQRIGQRIGLHRDGDMLKLPPFEGEIRRRLWWQIIMLEGFSQKLAGTGTGSNASILMGDVKLPANLNDSDLFPGMTEMPKESDRATEMMFFLIRCHVGNFLKRFETPQAVFDGVWNKLTTSAVDVSTKEKAIGELERLFEHKFLRHCDSSIAWHLMCSHLAKAIIFMMRFMAYGADYQGKTETREERDTLFTLALQVCSAQILAYTMKEMQGFMWHVNMHFQWKALVFVLSELRYRTSGSQVEEAWRDVQLTYEFHPTFDEELSKRALPIAVSNLALKAWDIYIAENGVPDGGEPYFIQLIRNRPVRSKKLGKTSEQRDRMTTEDLSTYMPSPPQQAVNTRTTGNDQLAAFPWNSADLNASLGLPPAIPDLAPPEYPEQLDWASWNSLLVDFQTNNADEYLPDMSAFNFEV